MHVSKKEEEDCRCGGVSQQTPRHVRLSRSKDRDDEWRRLVQTRAVFIDVADNMDARFTLGITVTLPQMPAALLKQGYRDVGQTQLFPDLDPAALDGAPSDQLSKNAGSRIGFLLFGDFPASLKHSNHLFLQL